MLQFAVPERIHGQFPAHEYAHGTAANLSGRDHAVRIHGVDVLLERAPELGRAADLEQQAGERPEQRIVFQYKINRKSPFPLENHEEVAQKWLRNRT